MAAITSRSSARIFAIAYVVIAALLLTTVTTEAFIGKPNANNSIIVRSYATTSTRSMRAVHSDLGRLDLLRAHNTGGENNKNDEMFPDDESVDVDGGLNNLMKDTQDLMVGDWVVAKRDVPRLGIRAGAVYKLLAIFLKGAGGGGDNSTGGTTGAQGIGVEVVPLERYGDDEQQQQQQLQGGSYTKYLRVYNPRDHDKMKNPEQGVLVTPEEIGLVSVKADWTEALYLAVPGFFWVFVAMSFSNYYTDRYGGSFLDAFFRT
jgi:hypothetical protein